MRRGTNYNTRMTAGHALALDVIFARAAARRAAGRAPACSCQHPAGEHHDGEGCLHGWGDDGTAPGCMCPAAPDAAGRRDEEATSG